MSALLRPARASTMVIVRRALIALTGIGILATAFELASERHWNGFEQLIPWLALVVLTAAALLLLLPDGRGTTAVRLLAFVVLAASLYGVVEHLLANFDAGPLDQRFADTWDLLPLLEQIWLVVTKTVGPAPALAPGVLGQTALLLFLATLCQSERPGGTPSSCTRPGR